MQVTQSRLYAFTALWLTRNKELELIKFARCVKLCFVHPSRLCLRDALKPINVEYIRLILYSFGSPYKSRNGKGTVENVFKYTLLECSKKARKLLHPESLHPKGYLHPDVFASLDPGPFASCPVLHPGPFASRPLCIPALLHPGPFASRRLIKVG